jgi:hypothetical protein
MLDCFEIVTTSGVVLWSRSNAPVSSNVVNSLINDVFIEEKVRPTVADTTDASSQAKPTYRFEKYTLKWTLVKDLGLIFVVSKSFRPCKCSRSLTNCWTRPSTSLFCSSRGLTSFLTTSGPFSSMSTRINSRQRTLLQEHILSTLTSISK